MVLMKAKNGLLCQHLLVGYRHYRVSISITGTELLRHELWDFVMSLTPSLVQWNLSMGPHCLFTARRNLYMREFLYSSSRCGYVYIGHKATLSKLSLLLYGV